MWYVFTIGDEFDFTLCLIINLKDYEIIKTNNQLMRKHLPYSNFPFKLIDFKHAIIRLNSSQRDQHCILFFLKQFKILIKDS